MQKRILITGCHRGGTTLLASMIGSHKDIAIINEDYFDGYERILSKKYIGTKAVIPTILLNKKRSKIYIALYRKFSRIIRFFFRSHPVGLCNYAINDFDYVIFISRDYKANVKSIMERTGVSKKSAERDVDRAIKIRKSLMRTPNVFLIELNKLTTRPDPWMRAICVYLRLSYDPNMLEGFKHTPTYTNNRIEIKS